jgi:hypothetical protein
MIHPGTAELLGRTGTERNRLQRQLPLFYLMIANYAHLFTNKQFTFLAKTMINESVRMNWKRLCKFIKQKTQKIISLFYFTQRLQYLV